MLEIFGPLIRRYRKNKRTLIFSLHERLDGIFSHVRVDSACREFPVLANKMSLPFGGARNIAAFPVTDGDNFLGDTRERLMNRIPAVLTDRFIESDVQFIRTDEVLRRIDDMAIEFILRVAIFIEKLGNFQCVGIKPDAQERVVFALNVSEFLD